MKRKTREPPAGTHLSLQLNTGGSGCGVTAWASILLALLGIAVSIALAKGWL